MKVYAVLHSLGLSLVKADNPQSALRKARDNFGSHAAPYQLGSDDDKAWAYGMDARVLE